MSDRPQEDKRNYYRALAEVTVRFGPDTPQARQALAADSDMWQIQSELEQAARSVLEGDNLTPQDRSLITVIRWMDFKIDLLLHQVRLSQQAQHFPGSLITTDLSGSGFGLSSAEGLKQGQRILLALVLPDSPYRPIYAVGQVVRIEPDRQPGQAVAAVEFVEISESDRERVIHYTFRQQRRALAQRSEEDKD